MFKDIERETVNNHKEESKKQKFPTEWWDDDCDGDNDWNKEWDDFDWDSPREDDEDEWEDWEED